MWDMICLVVATSVVIIVNLDIRHACSETDSEAMDSVKAYRPPVSDLFAESSDELATYPISARPVGLSFELFLFCLRSAPWSMESAAVVVAIAEDDGARIDR